jgi:hypothetical protein
MWTAKCADARVVNPWLLLIHARAGDDRVVSVADELTSSTSRTERDQIFAGTAIWCRAGEVGR